MLRILLTSIPAAVALLTGYLVGRRAGFRDAMRILGHLRRRREE